MPDAKRFTIIYKNRNKARFARVAIDTLNIEANQERAGIPKDLEIQRLVILFKIKNLRA